jgi:uncharacterized delta-60 repeat protein
MTRLLTFLLLCGACALLPVRAWAGGLPPEVTTNAAAVVDVGQVVLNGTVGANDGPTSVTIEYGPSTEYGFDAAVTPSGLDAYSVKTVSAVVGGLNPATTYHYRVNATSAFGTTYGQDMTVTPGLPAAVTNAAVVTGRGAVRLNGSVNGWGASAAVSFEVGLTTSYGSSISATPSNVSATTPTAVSVVVSGLGISSIYHCRVKAVNGLGTVYGDDVTIMPAQPTVITLAATSIGTGQATLEGTVKGNGLGSTVSFEYGPTTSYGSVAAAVPGSIATDQPTTAVSVALSGLTTTVTYHYRVKAVTSAGTTYGPDMTVTPKAGAPAATTLAATAVTNTDGTLQGLVNASGSSTSVTFQYGTSKSYGSSAGGTPSSITGTSDRVVTAVTSSFSPGTVIHYRVVASNASGTTFGADMTFTTTPNPPYSVTGYANLITASSAQLNANVGTYGGSSVVTFEYGLTTNYGTSTPAWQNPVVTNGATVNGQISGLEGGTTYHYRVRVVNDGGTITSQDNTLTTAAAVTGAPTVTTQAALPVNSTQATLNGIVNGNGSTTTVFFDFGTTTQYTESLFATTLANNVTDTAVTADVSNLIAGTTYHCRVRATDGSDGFIYGADVTFTAAASGEPVAATAPATLLTATLEQLNGYVSANGGATVTSAAFEYGTDTSYGSTAFVGGYIRGTGFQAVSAVIPFYDPSVTYHYRLRANTDSTTVYGEDMTFVTPDPHSAALGNLVLRGVTLQPGFATGTTNYSASVTYDTNTMQIKPTAAQSLAQVMVNEFVINPGGNAITLPLNVGDNTINVVVTAMDGTTTQTYTVVVTRGQPRAGDLDFTFGFNSGKTRISVGSGNALGTRLLQQPDGKLLMAGYAVNSGSSDVALIRMLPDGSLDSAFNGTGVVTTDNAGQGDYGVALALQPDGKILVAGYTYNGTNNDLLLLRYNGDGTLDGSFNGTGMVVTALSSGNDMAAGVAVQSDGGIVVAGTTWNETDNDFAVVRYTSAGLLDTSFNSTGKVVTDFGGHLNETASDMALQSGGRIVVVGTSGAGGTDVACYTSAGALDTNFNGTGLVTTSNDMSVKAVALQGDGKVVVAGSSYNGGDSDFTLLRYTSAGALDTSFNGTGTVTTDIGARGYDDPGGLVIQNDGRIVVAGRSATEGGVVTFSLARYDALGVLDGNFGSGGLVNLSFGSFEQGAVAVALQDDGKIVAAGYTGISTDQNFAVARFLGDGPGMAVTQQSNGVKIFDGLAAAEIGQTLAGATVSQIFTIKNSGLEDLSGFALTMTGANAGDFTAVTTPAAPAPALSATRTMTLQVSFTPSSIGAKTAVLHVASNVPGRNGSFDIALTGNGLTDSQNWRLTWFGTTNAGGYAADSADPDNDGIPNLIEYAFGMSPTVAAGGVQVPQPQIVGDNYVLSFTQPNGVSGITYGAGWSATLNGIDWQPVADTGSGSLHIFSVPINGNTRLFMQISVTSP